MTEKTLPTTVKEWHAAIAAEANSSVEAVAITLETLGVKPQPVLPRTRTLNVNTIRIGGVKRAKDLEDRFSFEWAGLGDGLWALLSEGNSKGKTSILSTVRASLQGRFPGRIKRDVWSWIDSVEVGFAVDNVSYSVSLQKQTGETDEAKATASLMRRSDGPDVCLYSGPAGDGLKCAMGDMFMDELGFDHFHAFKSAQDQVVEHGWPAMSSALFISGPGGAIFGDHTEDGLPLRLIQMFIGLPWVSTYTAVSSSLKRAKSEQAKAHAAAATEKAKVSTRVAELQLQEREKYDELAKLPDRIKQRSELTRLDGLLVRAQANITSCRNKLEAARVLARETAGAHLEARRLQQQAKDEIAAGYVFRRLKPVCCPACESGFELGRFESTATKTCGLCGSTNIREDEDEVADLAAIDTAVRDSDSARKAAAEAVHTAESALESAEKARASYFDELQLVEDALSGTDRTETLLREIAVIEGRIKELNVTTIDEPEAACDRDGVTLEVLKVAEKLTKKMMESLQAEIMLELETEVFGLTERFGVRNLDTLTFKAHRMDLRQGGVDLTFGGLNSGENLRMRIATALATLKVARSRGFGRHPGLLILDSPAASEMSPEDFSALIGAVGTTVKEIPGVQVIVGAVTRPELDPVIPSDHRRTAMGSAGLF